MSSLDEDEIQRLLKELPFYDVLTEKPKIKKFSHVEILRELPFYDELNIVQLVIVFRNM